MPTRVYRYGLLAPTEREAEVRETLRQAGRYRNTLVEIERGRRAAIRTAEAQIGDIGAQLCALRDAENTLTDLLKNMHARRAISRSRSESVEDRAAIQDARLRKKEARQAFQTTRIQLRENPTLQAERDRIQALSAELQRSARKHCGVYWGTYLLVEAAHDQVRAAPLWDGAEPSDPRFQRFSGEGRVGMQLQGGLPVAEVFGDDTRLQIAQIDPTAWYDEKRGERKKASHTVLSLRIGSEGRAPIWARWPMTMHRPLPPGGMIKWATISLRKDGPREEWSLELTVSSPEVETTPRKGVVAIDIGWRKIDQEIRVAMWQGDDGQAGELRLPALLVSGLEKPEALRSTRDKLFDQARDALKAALVPLRVPVALEAPLKTLGQWRSPARLAAFCRRWKNQRFEGDVEAYLALETWRYHDHHLWAWESGHRRSTLRHRKELYRVFAASLADRYGTLVLEDFDLRTFAHQKPSEEPAENATARAHRPLAGVSELRLVLENAFRGRGGATEKVSARDSTKIHAACGSVEVFDAAKAIDHTCSACGVQFDQDANAAKVLLERWRGRSPPEGARACEKEGVVVASKRFTSKKARKTKEGSREIVGEAAE
jgi:hypothetical protein